MKMHDRLRLAREQRGFDSASEAAEALGVPYGTYSGHENGSRGITRSNAARYAAFFGVSPAWLEHGEGDGPTNPHFEPSVFRERQSLRSHIAELKTDQVRLDQAIAVVEGAMLSAGLNPEYLIDLRKLIRECLEEPIVLSAPDAEFDSRRASAKAALSQFLRQRNALANKE